jgi:ABC-type oligopeptide transport system substrate-binding subunit
MFRAQGIGGRRSGGAKVTLGAGLCFVIVVSLLVSACLQDHPVQPYYGVVKPPADQEFRWSDGGVPKIFDPSLAAVPPDTDLVRALYEGLTDYDPQSMQPIPAVAERWEASADNKIWTFFLRNNARWSNGDPVTAHDFVRSWRRTADPQRRAPHASLLANIVGVDDIAKITIPASSNNENVPAPTATNGNVPEPSVAQPEERAGARSPAGATEFGVEAVSDGVLRVRLEHPDSDFPSLVAHPAFRPSHDVNTAAASPGSVDFLVTNGAFKLSKVEPNNVLLERSTGYWDAGTVALKTVRFVSSLNSEAALSAYQAGEVDAVTNTGFEPLAIKLLSPYKDFRRSTYGSLNFYRFNTARAPFSDVRVRQALAVAFDRDRLIEDETKGTSEPATSFLPVQMPGPADIDGAKVEPIKFDITRARELMASAGFPDGKGFPRIQLLINRNEQQRQVAQAVIDMWRSALGVEADIIIKNWDEYEAAIAAGEFDIVRRGVVMQTTDETANMMALLDTRTPTAESADTVPDSSSPTPSPNTNAPNAGPATTPRTAPGAPTIFTQSEALAEMPAIPLYFASSYSMVKPYVSGFDTNLLDAPSLKRVRIDTAWQPAKSSGLAWFGR